MGKTKLFENWTWKRGLPEPFGKLASKKRTDVYSVYNSAPNRESTLHAPILSAVLSYIDVNTTNTNGASGTNGGDTFITEYQSHRGETHVCVYNKDTGKFTAGVFKDASSTPGIYELKSTGAGQSGAALFFALIPFAIQDSEFNREYLNLMKYKTEGFTDMEAAVVSAAVLCDNLYRRIENADNLGENGIKTDIASTGNIQPITALNMGKGMYNPSKVITGKFEILKVSSAVKTSEGIDVDKSDFEGKYSLSEREFTDKEKMLIPKLEEWYIIPEEVVEVCSHAKQTTDSTVQMRNFMFRGPSGTGKTEGARAVAAGFGIPYTYITCSANTEISDLLGQILPDVKNSSDSGIKGGIAYPTFEDIRMDPSTAYHTLTGEYNGGITEEEVYGKLIETIKKDAASQNGGQGFMYVDTPLVNAIRYGYVCELQEPSIIANPGVLVGLNAMLDNCRTVTLPTGEVIERHPDTVIIIATNNDYNGCRDVNRATRSAVKYSIKAAA